jgi:hypothetical protein
MKRLHTKIFLGFAAVIVVLCLCVTFSIMQTQKIVDATEVIYSKYWTASDATLNALNAVLRTEISIEKMMRTQTSVEFKKQQERTSVSLLNLEDELDVIRERTQDKEYEKLLAQITGEISRVENLVAQIGASIEK